MPTSPKRTVAPTPAEGASSNKRRRLEPQSSIPLDTAAPLQVPSADPHPVQASGPRSVPPTAPRRAQEAAPRRMLSLLPDGPREILLPPAPRRVKPDSQSAPLRTPALRQEQPMAPSLVPLGAPRQAQPTASSHAQPGAPRQVQPAAAGQEVLTAPSPALLSESHTRPDEQPAPPRQVHPTAPHQPQSVAPAHLQSGRGPRRVQRATTPQEIQLYLETPRHLQLEPYRQAQLAAQLAALRQTNPAAFRQAQLQLAAQQRALTVLAAERRQPLLLPFRYQRRVPRSEKARAQLRAWSMVPSALKKKWTEKMLPELEMGWTIQYCQLLEERKAYLEPMKKECNAIKAIDSIRELLLRQTERMYGASAEQLEQIWREIITDLSKIDSAKAKEICAALPKEKKEAYAGLLDCVIFFAHRSRTEAAMATAKRIQHLRSMTYGENEPRRNPPGADEPCPCQEFDELLDATLEQEAWSVLAPRIKSAVARQIIWSLLPCRNVNEEVRFERISYLELASRRPPWGFSFDLDKQIRRDPEFVYPEKRPKLEVGKEKKQRWKSYIFNRDFFDK